MTTVSLQTVASTPDTLDLLVAAIRRLDVTAVVVDGATDLDLVVGLADCGIEVVVVDRSRERLAAAQRRLVGLDLRAVTLLHGATPRVVADLRLRLPKRTAFVLGIGARSAQDLRDTMLWASRGDGLVAIRLDPSRGLRDVADIQDALLRWSPDHVATATRAADGGVVLVCTPRARVHVTFLIEKYTHDYGTSGLSINLDNLVATLAATGQATWNVVHYDECCHEGRPLPFEQLRRPDGVDAHVLAVTCHYHSPANPSVELLQRIRATGTKVAFFWLDKKISQDTPDYWRVADLNVVLDGNDFELPNAWPIFTPKNPVHFCDPGLTRDIDVSLVGEVRYLAQRKAFVSRLERETRIQVAMPKTSAADPTRALSVAEYARVYQRSKISLALTKDAVRQLKGRVFEILHCGAMLMCDVNHHLGAYLTPGEHYVVFHDYEDLVAKCAHYLAHDDERRAIAASGHARVKAFFGHDVFWRSLLARLGASAAAIGRG